MPADPSWEDIAVRILATLVAGLLIGANREQGGHAAGLRTTMLVGLAACISMIQANLLLSTSESANGSMDILRFPLGILTGVGFIGGGAILRRGDIATGVTTAATLWVITAIGLSFGGGQIIVGTVATIVALAVLSPLKHITTWLACEQKSSVTIQMPKREHLPDITEALPKGSEARFTAIQRIDDHSDALVYEIRWRSKLGNNGAGEIAEMLRERFIVIAFEYRATMT
ncbi:MgtC/SapB family protein [Rhizobium sp. S152]|uniref:MgtC/SapB family protein n=1 Tax=Rhizobium sp. S152 TaxID=3055038 RepID=UPI0025A93A81|nr:MgtC/SapB family protein [Rhizobium sp. S152]MDM9625579.1 MgtC/SapB family protein [Rhizobium sp. S152]